MGIGGQGGKDVMEFRVVGIPGGPFGWGGKAGLQDAGDNILRRCAEVVEEVGEVGVDEGRGKGSGSEGRKGGAEEMRGGVVGKVKAWIEDVLVRGRGGGVEVVDGAELARMDLAEEVKAGVGVLEDGAEPRSKRELGGWRVRWGGVDWEGGQVGPRERMGTWRRKLKGEWPACGCHNLGGRGRRRRVNREGRSGAQRDWLGRWQRYGIGYSTIPAAGGDGVTKGGSVEGVLGGWRESGGKRQGERREWRSEGDGMKTGTGWWRGPSIARIGPGQHRRAGRTNPGQ
eukprot:scaffold7139_cov100-Amphora_coffeaeformis.AAC.6